MFKYTLIFFALFLGLGHVNGQDKYYKLGVKYFQNGLYQKALDQFYLDKTAPKNKDLLLKRIIANYETNKLDAAKRDVPRVLSFDKVPDEIYWVIAKIYHAELNFEKAIEFYKEFLRKTSLRHPNRHLAVDEIKRCATGLDLRYYEQEAFVENMGPEINTVQDEIDPVQSPNYLNKFYFSSNRFGSEGGLRDKKGLKDDQYGQPYMDMYTATLENGKWININALNSLLNTAKHERVLDFSEDGSILLFMKGEDKESGTLHIDTFGMQSSEVYPPNFDSPLSGKNGDTYLYFFNDSTLIFSSKRNGGYGGYDLYASYRLNNRWSKPKNLGPKINTAYDEITPFISKDGLKLYFSSNNQKSIGGFDVFKSIYSIESSGWSKPENLGIGINSAGDDTHYRLSADGQSSYFSSNRKTGIGKNDLYIAYLKEQELSQLGYRPLLPFLANDDLIRSMADREGLVNEANNTGDMATEATINAKKEEPPIREFVIDNVYYGEDENLITPNSKKNLDNIIDVLTIFPETKVEINCFTINESQVAYELYFTLKRGEKISAYLEENGIDQNRIMIRAFGSNYPLVKEIYAGRKNTLAEKLNRRIEIRIMNTEKLPLKVNYIEPVVADYLKAGTNELYLTIVEGLSYKIQIASVRQMYQNQVLNQYQDVGIEKHYGEVDYIYTIGLYKRFTDAQKTLNLLKTDGIPDALVVPYIDNKRMNKAEVLDRAINYPDLVNYLQYTGQ